ncbi:MAG: hypothetical protein LBC72_05940 [Spirochaetaceae bacterium]|jgi:hypothetical protein|nr:hypothetical protein [Spirochaetaceae bacterium]
MPTGGAGGHRAFRSNLFAYRKKYFHCNRLRCSKSAAMRILNMVFGKAKHHTWLPAAIHGGASMRIFSLVSLPNRAAGWALSCAQRNSKLKTAKPF